MTNNDVLLLILLLQIKHFICDGPLQTKAMVDGKAIYGNRLGLLHAGIHGLGTIAALAWFGLDWKMVLALADCRHGGSLPHRFRQGEYRQDQGLDDSRAGVLVGACDGSVPAPPHLSCHRRDHRQLGLISSGQVARRQPVIKLFQVRLHGTCRLDGLGAKCFGVRGWCAWQSLEEFCVNLVQLLKLRCLRQCCIAQKQEQPDAFRFSLQGVGSCFEHRETLQTFGR